MTKKIYRSMQGQEIDVEALMSQNELTIAVGNAKLNARGDELGPGGKILRKREEVVAEYYDTNPKAQPSVKPAVSSKVMPVAQVADESLKTTRSKGSK